MKVNSTRVKEADFDPDTGELRVVFRDGTPWVYEDVPATVWKRFKESKSKGRFVTRILGKFENHPEDG